MQPNLSYIINKTYYVFFNIKRIVNNIVENETSGNDTLPLVKDLKKISLKQKYK